VKVLCLVIVNVNVTKYVPQKCQIWQICGYHVRFFQPPNTPKLVFGRGPRPRWGSLRHSLRSPSRLGRGTPHPHSLPPRHLWHLDLGASVVRPPPTQIPGYTYGIRSMLLIMWISGLVHCWFYVIVQEIDRMNQENERLRDRLKQIESQVCASLLL